MVQWVATEKGEDDDDELLPELDALHYNEDYVIRTWIEHKIHHTYPEPGGYNDQDPYLMSDWHTLNLCYVRVWAGQLTVPEFLAQPGNRTLWTDSGLMDG
jgi:hypothetical protein